MFKIGKYLLCLLSIIAVGLTVLFRMRDTSELSPEKKAQIVAETSPKEYVQKRKKS